MSKPLYVLITPQSPPVLFRDIVLAMDTLHAMHCDVISTTVDWRWQVVKNVNQVVGQIYRIDIEK